MSTIIFAVNATYYFLYFVIISRMVIGFTTLRYGGFYNFIMKSSEMVIAPFRTLVKNNGLIDFSPLFALLFILFAKNILLAVLLYLPTGNVTAFSAAVIIVVIDMVDLLLGFYLALVIIFYFVKIQINKIIRSNVPMFGGFSPDRLLFMLGRWINPLAIPLGRNLPDSLKKYAEIILIFMIIIVKLLLKYSISYIKINSF